ncbi:MAG: arsenosugar biosynthesis radical SAM (seleno)protein ArsS [Flavobacteriales bacterium]
MIKSLKAREHELAYKENQVKFLSNGIFKEGHLPTFAEKIKQCGDFPLRSDKVDIFQVNVGYMCNQVCKHCHVDAGPDRKEIMTRETIDQCLEAISAIEAKTLDLTGGSPEMNPHFRYFVEEAVKRGVEEIIVRCNLTIILANKKYHDLPDFFKKNKVHVVSSLPYFDASKTDRQRGDGVFDKSIEALKMLNAVGYGIEGSGLQLDLVYNPAGAFLPGNQAELEAQFKKQLKQRFNIEFNNLFCITNIPISRFLDYLIASENYEGYMEKLVNSFNPQAVKGVMCKNTLSVSWDGYLYDCDFNQMLGLAINPEVGRHVSEMNIEKLNNRVIAINQHCFGCTAGAGSSCQGTVA